MSDLVLMKGNEALAEAAIVAGCRHFFGYPITPQTELAAYMSKKMPKVGGVYLQAESEVAAANMLLGSAAAGVRAMTSSSSPGISLKSEAISYMAASDLPVLIINVQRGGPGLGGIQPSQADYFQATKAVGHGDFHVLVYAPSTVQEMVDLVSVAFDTADTYRMPAMILADGMLGQMMEPVTINEPEMKNTEKPWATNGHRDKRERNIVNSLHLDPYGLEKTVVDRYKRYDEIKAKHQMSSEYMTEDAEIVIVSYGASSRVVRTAVDNARAEGIKLGMIRPITLWPFPSDAIYNLSEKVDKMLVVEMSMGQMIEDVKLSVKSGTKVDFYGRTGGIIPTPKEITDKVKEILKGGL